MTAFLRSRVDASYTVRCECERPCATYEQHWRTVGQRFEAAGRFWSGLADHDAVEPLFPASETHWRPKLGEILAGAAIAFSATVWFLMVLAAWSH